MHDTVVSEVLNCCQHAPHVVLDFYIFHLIQIRQKRLRLLVAEYKRYLAFLPVPLNQFGDIVFSVQIF